MPKKGKTRKDVRVRSDSGNCPKCNTVMQRRERIKPPTNKTYFFTEWDYCPNCSFIQHYEEFKSTDWQESEEMENHFFSI